MARAAIAVREAESDDVFRAHTNNLEGAYVRPATAVSAKQSADGEAVGPHAKIGALWEQLKREYNAAEAKEQDR